MASFLLFSIDDICLFCQFCLSVADGEVFWWYQNITDLFQHIYVGCNSAPKFAPRKLVRDSCVNDVNMIIVVSTLPFTVLTAKSYCGLCCVVLLSSQDLPTLS